MPSKDDVNKILSKVFFDDFIGLWWGLEIAGLGKARPEDVWEQDPERVLEYVRGYLDESFN